MSHLDRELGDVAASQAVIGSIACNAEACPPPDQNGGCGSDFAHRTGFVRLALKHGVRIIPVVWIGGQETALFLGQGEHIA